MANIKSQIKRNRQNLKHEASNKARRSELRTLKKSALAAAGTDTEAEALKAAIRKIDIAATKGVMHKNNAARQKSRLIKKLAAEKSEK